MEDRARLLKEADDADEKASQLRGERDREAAKPQTATGRDPQVQAYADKYFRGSYSAAEAAIKKQRGQ